MSYQLVRAIKPVNHNNVVRLPGVLTGANAQDFVVADAQAAGLIGLAAVTSLGVAEAPLEDSSDQPTAVYQNGELVGFRTLGGPVKKFLAVAPTPGGGLDARSVAALAASGAIGSKLRRNYKIVLDGDSTVQAQLLSYPQTEASNGWRYVSSLTLTPAQASTWIVSFNLSYKCASGNAATIEFNGTDSVRVAIAGDTPGDWVNIIGGTYFTLTSGTNGKTAFIALRNRNIPTAAISYAFTDPASAQAPGRIGVSGIFFGGLMRSGAMIGNTIKNYSLGGDRPEDVYNRLPQIIAEAPDLYCLNVGVNWITDASDWIIKICNLLNSKGIPVLVTPTLPRVWDAGTTAVHEAQVAAILAINNPMTQVVDLYSTMRDFTSNTEIAIASQYNADRIHPSANASLQRLADILGPTFRKLLPGVGLRRPVNAQTAYNAASNSQGNYLGALAAMAGTGGTFGATPTPTGQLPTSWTDLYWSGTGFASVVYTSPASGSPIPCSDDPTKYWSQVVATTATGTCSRGVYVQCPTVPEVGKKVRVRGVLQLVNVTNYYALECSLTFTGSTGQAQWLVLQPGTGSVASNSIEDSGVLYFESDDIEVPPGTTASKIILTYTCSTGGSMTLRWRDFDVFPSPK